MATRPVDLSNIYKNFKKLPDAAFQKKRSSASFTSKKMVSYRQWTKDQLICYTKFINKDYEAKLHRLKMSYMHVCMLVYCSVQFSTSFTKIVKYVCIAKLLKEKYSI